MAGSAAERPPGLSDSAGFADDKLHVVDDSPRFGSAARNAVEEQVHGVGGHAADRLGHNGKRWVHECGPRRVVEGHQRDVSSGTLIHASHRRARAVGALIAGITADLLGLRAAIWLVAAITAASGLIVAARMYETHSSGSATQPGQPRSSGLTRELRLPRAGAPV